MLSYSCAPYVLLNQIATDAGELGTWDSDGWFESTGKPAPWTTATRRGVSIAWRQISRTSSTSSSAVPRQALFTRGGPCERLSLTGPQLKRMLFKPKAGN